MAKFIFVTGGVVSSLGKGINASSLGRLLKSRGLKVFMQKFDPYINVDPGNMSPLQHGEVFVTDDGAETDLDLGHYERFIDENLSKYSSVTTGKIYLKVIEKERRGEYGGKTVQVIPHITNEIKEAVYDAAKYSGADIVITEVGGTVGDIESLPFLEAIRQVRRELGVSNTLYIHNTLVPYLEASKEIKTKPTQHSVKELRSLGINPDIIILRSEKPISKVDKEKIALFCDVSIDAVIEARDAKNLYEIPLKLANQKLDQYVVKHFNIDAKELDLREWLEMLDKVNKQEGEIKVAIVGKYVALQDAYLSIIESLKHAGIHLGVNVKIEFIDAEKIDKENIDILADHNGILVPGGFGERAIEGKINAIKYARERGIPYFGICLGMQLALIEYTRNALGYKDASSREFDETTSMPIIDLKYSKKGMESPMRLGLFPCKLKDGTKIKSLYKQDIINERHRHRYEFNNEYLNIYENTDLVISGVNPDSGIVETIELKNHPWFIGCQFHPEFLSRPTRPHPLFMGFVEACIKNK
ncbi:MAG TPA: CTP synthase [Acholeplasmataceae bacterium]|nr:CTP synthase [Acholeplasmataceae bacterium]